MRHEYCSVCGVAIEVAEPFTQPKIGVFCRECFVRALTTEIDRAAAIHLKPKGRKEIN